MRPIYVSNTPDFYDQLEAAHRAKIAFDLVYVGEYGAPAQRTKNLKVESIKDMNDEFGGIQTRIYDMRAEPSDTYGLVSQIVMERRGTNFPPLTVRPTRDELWMQTALLWSKRSTCTRNQVGCVITDEDRLTALAIGYNGNAKGLENTCDAPSTAGACGCIHAEENALIKAPGTMKNKVMYTTTSPCLACAKRIINANIRKVMYASEYRDGAGIKLLRDAGIGLELLKID